jgi:hypothetical protein
LVKEFLGISKDSRNSYNKVGRRNHKTTKRKKKRYLYARTQDFYKKDHGALARYIREGIPCPDTIPHQALKPALERLGIPASLRNYIANSYRQLKTRIEYKGLTTDVILNRGVKQGDPLSPYIFNAIMNPLLETLEQLGGYSIDGAHTITALAFADDLILVADDHNTAQDLLTLTERYFKQLGMTIAAQKYSSFQIETRDSCHLMDTHLSLAGGEIILSISANDSITYLGGLISPWSGLQHKGHLEKLQQALQRLDCTSLKPHQKLNL